MQQYAIFAVFLKEVAFICRDTRTFAELRKELHCCAELRISKQDKEKKLMADAVNQKPRWGTGRVTFLARLEQIQTLIEAGNGRRAVYDSLGGISGLGIGYSQFNRYVKRYLMSQEVSALCTSGTPKGDQAPNKDMGLKRPGFQYDPSSAHKRDDLI